MSGAARFWGTAALAAAAVAGLSALVPLAPALEADTDARRLRIWLLCVFTAGVMALLLGLSARLGAFRGLGFRDVRRAGSVEAALQERERLDRARGTTARFDLWVMATGALLLATYLAAWLATR